MYIYKKQTNATEVPPWSRRDLIFRLEDAVPAAAHMQRQSPAPGSGAWGCTGSLFLYPHSRLPSMQKILLNIEKKKI